MYIYRYLHSYIYTLYTRPHSSMYIYIYMYIPVCIFLFIYIYTYLYIYSNHKLPNRFSLTHYVLQWLAVFGSVLQTEPFHHCGSHIVCCSVLQCVAICCSVLQCVAVCCSVLLCIAVCCSVLQQCRSHTSCITFAHSSQHYAPHREYHFSICNVPVYLRINMCMWVCIYTRTFFFGFLCPSPRIFALHAAPSEPVFYARLARWTPGVTWLIHDSFTRRETFICMTWLIHVSWNIHLFDVTHSCVMRHSCVWHDSFTRDEAFMLMTWFIHVL